MIHRHDFLAASDRRRKIVDKMMTAFLLMLTFLAILPLIWIFVYVLQRGLPSINIDFFTQLPKPVGETGGGLANALIGSLTVAGIASLIGVPWGMATGIYLSEYETGKVAHLLRFSIDLLASVPSIIVGLFVYALVVLPMKTFSAYAGGFALSIIMIPQIARSTEEVLKLTPLHIREAGLALGIPRWKVVLRIVLRGSIGGVMTGVILSLARALGETAPMLFTAFGNHYWARNLSQPTATLPVQIYTYAVSPFEEWHKQAWAAALVLLLFVVIMNIVVRSLVRRPRY